MRSSLLDASRDALVPKVALAATLGLIGASQPAFAVGAAGPMVGVSIHQASGSPATYFTLNARPGEQVQAGSLTVSNPTDHAVSVSIDPVNGLTASSLGSTYAMANSPASGSTRWLRLGARHLLIPRHGSSAVGVAVLVPRSAPAGEYLSGVAVQALQAATHIQPASGIEVGQVYRYAIGVETRLPGRRAPRLSLTGARVERYPGSVTFLLLARNDGNVILRDVHGTVIVTQGGRQVLVRTIPSGTFVSQTSIQIPESAPREEPSASTVYHVRAGLIYEGGSAHLDTNVTFGEGAAAVQALYTHSRRKAEVLVAPLLVGLCVGFMLVASAAVLGWRDLVRGMRGRPAGVPVSDSTPRSS